MEEDDLSGYGQQNSQDQNNDFGDIDLDQIEEYENTRMNNNLDDLSDYEEEEGLIMEAENPEFFNQTGLSKTPTEINANSNFFDTRDFSRIQGKSNAQMNKKQLPLNKSNVLRDTFFDESRSQATFDNQTVVIRNEFETAKSGQTSVYRPNNAKNDDQEQLSGYDDDEEEDVSKYQASLFGNLDQIKSALSTPSEKNSLSNVKRSQATGAFIKSKNEIFSKYKSEKQEKFNESISSYNGDLSTQFGSKRQKPDNKKRFSKKQLELVSRFFAQYYAYETKSQYNGKKITLRDIGQKFGLGHATIHKLYAEWMDDPYFYERIKRYDRYRKQTKNPERKLTLDRLEHITRLIKQNPFLTQHELCVELNKINELKTVKCGKLMEITRTIVGKLLKMGKFRKKRVKCVPKQKNTTKSLEKRYEYCHKYYQILQRRSRIYFLDESGLNLYMTRDKAWSRPNQEITVNCPISKGKRFSLIAVIGQEGVAHWRFIEGNYRKFEYLDFIRELFQKIKQRRQEQNLTQQIWIVMDNCAIHDKQQTINLAREYDLNILYLPSYSPQLNPIENWFHEVKVKLKKINYSGEKQLFTIMNSLLKSYEDKDFSNYYHSTLKYAEKGMRKEKF